MNDFITRQTHIPFSHDEAHMVAATDFVSKLCYKLSIIIEVSAEN